MRSSRERPVQHYVCGFYFSFDRRRVVLIRKRRPAWQAGRLNGVGGKVEPGESLAQAMRREFNEEAGMDVAGWTQVVRLTGPDWCGHFFRAFGDVDAARSMTDERLEIHRVEALPADTIDNLPWIVRILLDDEVAAGEYRVETVPAADPFDTR